MAKGRSRSVSRVAQRELRSAVKGSKSWAAFRDSYQNFEARLGLGTDNQSSAGGYGFHPITRLRQTLEFAYRGSWLVRMAVDCVAQDMTREGIDFVSTLDPD